MPTADISTPWFSGRSNPSNETTDISSCGIVSSCHGSCDDSAQGHCFVLGHKRHGPGSTPTATPGIGDGTWDLTATNWNATADGTGTPIAWTEGNDAVFAAGTDLSNDPTTGVHS